MAEEEAAAHCSTQQPVSRQKAESDKKDGGFFLNLGSNTLSEVIRHGKVRMNMNTPNVHFYL